MFDVIVSLGERWYIGVGRSEVESTDGREEDEACPDDHIQYSFDNFRIVQDQA